MVLIPLKSQFVSLIISLVSLGAELALLSATLRLHRFFECRSLQKGSEVSVCRHQRRVGWFSVSALLAFLALEITTSFLSEPARRISSVDQRCIAVDALDRRTGLNGLTLAEDFVSMRCNDFRDTTILYKAGNYSFVEKRAMCSSSIIVEYNVSATSEYILDGAQWPSAQEPNPNPVLYCSDGICIVVKIEFATSIEGTSGTIVKLSKVFKENNLEQMRESRAPIRTIETLVLYDVSSLQTLFAERALNAATRTISDPVELIRRVFLGSESTICAFDQDLGEATSVPLEVLCIVAAIWLSSALVCVSSLIVRARIFYDISNPLHWAKHTRHSSDGLIKGDPMISTIHEGGTLVVHVSDSQRK